ncbi:hypothetical protein M2347_001786 [Chryseobacterium sp. H1D6B]|jgi:hypothetical protein|uniref:hypothetical protein n=1 Tax=Chryseobacterium sp. H1D6B TaxID=2940588 RepID=UPI0015C97903|nr:hypothetical protein [Chryseobacterium sp. H1D6B]MDH6252059.1 hypothetical protein [Chryseobacterium sp. H1D6B]
MDKKNPVLKNAQKLGREQQKSILGGAVAAPKRCCEWDYETGVCTLWTCNNCYCP